MKSIINLLCAKSLQLCLTHGDPMACGPPGSSVHGIPQANSGAGCPPPGNLPDSGMETVSLASPALADVFFTPSATWEAQTYYSKYYITVLVGYLS